jgi:hypothetical protein
VFKLLAAGDELGLIKRYVGIDVEGGKVYEDLHASDEEQGKTEVRVDG